MLVKAYIWVEKIGVKTVTVRLLVADCHHPAELTTTNGPAVNNHMPLPLPLPLLHPFLCSHVMCTYRGCLLFGASFFFFPLDMRSLSPCLSDDDSHLCR